MIGTVLGQRYRLLSQIGEGGMAYVYLAKDLKLERQVAIKILHPHMAKNNDIRQRFIREAKAISSMEHPNIVRVYDYSESDAGQIWIVSEYIDGPHLSDFVASQSPQNRLQQNIAALIVREICKALGAAHNRGIIHRDIKPENVMLTRRGQVKLMDFGIAKDMGHTSMTQTGTFMGSPSYMSKEQIKGKDIDYRSDIYSLNVLFFEILAGRLPFMGTTQHDVVMKIMEGKHPTLEDLLPNIDAKISAIVERGLQGEAHQRFQTIEEMGQELDVWLKNQGLSESHVELERFFKNPKLFKEANHRTGKKPDQARQITRTSIKAAKARRKIKEKSKAKAKKKAETVHKEAVLVEQQTVVLPSTVVSQTMDEAQMKTVVMGSSPAAYHPPKFTSAKVAAKNKSRPMTVQKQSSQPQSAWRSVEKPDREKLRRQVEARRRQRLKSLYRSTQNLESYFIKSNRKAQFPLVFLLLGFSLLIIMIIFKFGTDPVSVPQLPVAEIFSTTDEASLPAPQEPAPKTGSIRSPNKNSNVKATAPAPGPISKNTTPAKGDPASQISVGNNTPTTSDGEILLSSTPAAEIFIDDQRVGTTNASLNSSGWLQVKEGRRSLELRRPGYKNYKQLIQVKKGQKLNIPHISLERLGEAAITIQTTPTLLGTKLYFIEQKSPTQRFTFVIKQQRMLIKVPYGTYKVVQILKTQKRERVININDQYKNLTYSVEFD